MFYVSSSQLSQGEPSFSQDEDSLRLAVGSSLTSCVIQGMLLSLSVLVF